MSNTNTIAWENIHTLVFDFDGIFTNNKVILDQNGIESVQCDRSDGLAFDILRKFIKQNDWKLEYFILSTEKNNVVRARADKLKIRCYQGVDSKLEFLQNYILERFSGEIAYSSGIVFLGNDLNDLAAMNFSGYSVSPNNGHRLVKEAADLVIDQSGGNGFVRAFIEMLIDINNFEY